MISSLKYSDDGFQKIQKALDDKFYVEVGIQGSEASTKHGDSEYTNAQIGAVHEMGSLSRHIPRRSFLVDPLSEAIPDWFNDSRNRQMYVSFAELGNIKLFYNALSRFAERVVDDCFKSSNRGRWADLKPATVARRRGGGAIQQFPLMDTGQLRRSITSKVRKGK